MVGGWCFGGLCFVKSYLGDCVSWLFGGEVASVRVYPTAVKEGTESEVEAITELTENNGSM